MKKIMLLLETGRVGWLKRLQERWILLVFSKSNLVPQLLPGVVTLSR